MAKIRNWPLALQLFQFHCPEPELLKLGQQLKMSKRRNHFTSSSFYGNQTKLKKFSLIEAVQLIHNEDWDASPADQADQPVVASQPAKQSLQPSVRHQNCASMVGLPAEKSPTKDSTIPHANKDADSELDAQFEYSDVSDDDNKVTPNMTDADSELDAQFEYSDVSDDDNKVTPNMTDHDSDDTVEDVNDFDFLDDCAEDLTNMTGAQTSPEHPEGASVTSSPDPASETSECTKSLTSPEGNTSKGVKIQREGKRYFCIFCRKYLAQHLNRHLIKSHSEEPDVAAAQALPEPQRSQALLILRNQGRDVHNEKILEGDIEGGLIVQRKPKTMDSKTLKKCTKCLGVYQRHGFARHKCVDKKPTGQLLVLQTDNSDQFVSHLHKVLNGIRNKDHQSIAVSDTLLRIVAKRFVSRHGMRNADYQHLRFNLNLLASLIKRFREVTGRQTTTAAEMISPQNFDDIIMATKDLAGFASNGHIRAPSCVGAVGRLLVECADALQGAEIKAGRAGQEAAQFQHLMSSTWAVDVGDAAALQLKEAKISKTAEVPLTSDIRIFCESLKEKINSLTKKIKKGASAELWRKLAEVVLAYIITFNRRRPTEAATMTLTDLKQLEKGIDSYTKELLLTEGEENVLKTLARVMLRGKRARPVPVILTPEVQEALHSLIEFREAGMVASSNPFVFALNSKGSNGYIRGSDALRVSVEGVSEKLQHPERLRSTSLRKEIATTAQVLALNEADFEVLCRWMGHTEAVHLRHYRQNFRGHQVTQMAPLLFAMEEGSIPQQKGTSLKDVTYNRHTSNSKRHKDSEEGDIRQEEDDDADPVPAVAGKSNERNYSKFSAEEEKAVRKLFQDSILGGKLPGKKQILLGIAGSQTLAGRSWTQIKDKVANEKRKHLKHMY